MKFIAMKDKATRLVKTLLFVAAGSLTVPSLGFAQSSVNEDHIKHLVQQFHTATSTGDIEFLEGIYSQDPEAILVGSDANEIIVGHGAIMQFWHDLFAGLSGMGYPNNGGLPTVSSPSSLHVTLQGNAAWVADSPTWDFANGDVPYRLTLGFRIEDGQWKIIQTHYSVGKSNAELPL